MALFLVNLGGTLYSVMVSLRYVQGVPKNASKEEANHLAKKRFFWTPGTYIQIMLQYQ